MACPGDDDLSSYLAGRVTAELAQHIAAHLIECMTCEAVVEMLGADAPLASAATVPAAGTPATGGSPDARPGDAVGGYVLQQRVGAGGMGVVWEAYDPELDRTVALKLMRDAAPHLRARFEREVRITARLQHPSIVNVFEAGTWRGEPYYVMKLVRGESLDRALAARGALADRLALLPAVLAVVEAIAYAHGARVIHRDLKPENVLVGEFGEAVVIDWGLAKALEAPRDSAPELREPAAAGGTVAGAVLGTPAYMAPEQARGEPVDARADVYALGAILYVLLAGERPYAGAADVVAAVAAGPPAPLPADVPAELATIVARAMAREAGDRYPSARELAEDLRRFQTGQLVASHRYSAGELVARWVRRHRAAVAVGAIAAIVLAVASGIGVRRILAEKQRATEQQHQAEDQRGEVEKLLTFMLVDLRDQLQPLGKIAVLEKIARQAEAYFAAPRASAGNPHVRFEALIALGDLHATEGHGAPSLAQYRAALLLARAYVALAPDLDWRRSVADAEGNVGAVQMDRAELPAAAASFRDALAIYQQLAAEAPGDDRTLAVATAHDWLGTALVRQGDAAGAIAEYRAEIALEQAIPGGRADVAHALAVAHTKLADALAVRGDLAGAVASQREAVAIMQRLADADPAANAHARDLGVFRGRLGGLLIQTGDQAGALAEDHAAIAILRRASEREPADAQVRGYLATALLFLAGDLGADAAAEALPLCEEARAIRAQQVAADPSNHDSQAHLMTAEGQTANTLKRLGRYSEAFDHARAAVKIAEQLVALDPTSGESREQLVLDYGSLGEILAHLDRDADALAAERAGLAVAEQLVAQDPSRVDWQESLSDRHITIGDVLASTDPASAAAEYRAALAISERLAAEHPGNADFAEDVKLIRGQLRALAH